MTVSEFSDQFDVLYNNITSNQAPGLNEYEKSVFLTKAQEEIVKDYFNPKSNPHQDGLDDSPKRQADFSSLITSTTLVSVVNDGSFDKRAKSFQYPSDVFLVLNEQIYSGTTPYVVVPISYREYDRLMAKPYKYPPKYQAWRLITLSPKDTLTSGTSEGNPVSNQANSTIAEIIGVFKDSAVTYSMRYIRRPSPIILANLSGIQNSLSIQGETEAMTSTLPDEIHEEILQRAVELAKVAWSGDVSAIIQTGQRSE